MNLPDAFLVLIKDAASAPTGYWIAGAYFDQAIAEKLAEKNKGEVRRVSLHEYVKSEERPLPVVRLNGDGSLDEVVSPGVHLEQMDFNHWFLAVDNGSNEVAIWLRAKGKVTATFEWRDISGGRST